MKRYFIASQGYYYPYEVETFTTLATARKALREAAREDLVSARRAGWKRAAIVKTTENSREVLASRHRQSPMWSRLYISQA